MKGIVTIFVMPQEIDDLHITLINIKKNIALLPKDVKLDLHLTLCVSDEITDWENSVLPKEYILHKFDALRPLYDWSDAPVIKIEEGQDIIGAISQRRFTSANSAGYDFVIWIDTDMFFGDATFFYLIETYKAIGNPYSIVTPQFVRQWDTTWDVIVNDNYKNTPLHFQAQADILSISSVDHGEASAIKIDTFKFAAGWCTLLGVELLNLIELPESMGHYGPDDTFIMQCCLLLKNNNHPCNPEQYVIQNIIAGENYKYRCNSHMKKFITSKNRKEEFKKIAEQSFYPELAKFNQRIST
jgi:hypothetical protein